MATLRVLCCAMVTGTLACTAPVVHAQDYPTKPIRILTSEAGAGSDFTARLIAQELTRRGGQQVIVDNRSSLIAIETAAKASPDGYTLLVAGPPLWISPLIQRVNFNTLRDFAPISEVNTAPSILVVFASLPVNSVKDLIALAKAKPGSLNYAAGATGAVNHLSAELFKAMAGIDLIRVNYKGTGPAVSALLAGEVQLMFTTQGPALPHVKSGKLRALAVTSAQPSALIPELPTVAASGLPGYEAVTTLGVFAPAKTPAALIARLNREIVGVLDTPDIKDRFSRAGLEVASSFPHQLTALMTSEIARMGRIIKDNNIRID